MEEQPYIESLVLDLQNAGVIRPDERWVGVAEIDVPTLSQAFGNTDDVRTATLWLQHANDTCKFTTADDFVHDVTYELAFTVFVREARSVVKGPPWNAVRKELGSGKRLRCAKFGSDPKFWFRRDALTEKALYLGRDSR